VEEILRSPSFPKKELNILKSRTLQNISIEKQKTSYLATAALTRNIYGEHHPYVAGMEEEILETIDQQQLRSFFQTNYSFPESEIILAGDFLESDREAIQNLLGQVGATNSIVSQARLFEPATSNTFMDLPEKLQSSIRIGRHWPLMSHPDFSRLSLINKILGGYFGSRLMKNIREEKGYTYGIFSTVSPKEHDSLFYIGTDVNYEKADETVSEILKEIRILKKELVSEEELETVKAYTVGKFINDTATIFDQSEKYKTIVLQNLSPDYYSQYLQDIQNLTAAEIPALMHEYLSEESLSIVVVGKKA
jgi:predicted Zn-dependent peptidase